MNTLNRVVLLSSLFVIASCGGGGGGGGGGDCGSSAPFTFGKAGGSGVVIIKIFSIPANINVDIE